MISDQVELNEKPVKLTNFKLSSLAKKVCLKNIFIDEVISFLFCISQYFFTDSKVI